MIKELTYTSRVVWKCETQLFSVLRIGQDNIVIIDKTRGLSFHICDALTRVVGRQSLFEPILTKVSNVEELQIRSKSHEVEPRHVKLRPVLRQVDPIISIGEVLNYVFEPLKPLEFSNEIASGGRCPA